MTLNYKLEIIKLLPLKDSSIIVKWPYYKPCNLLKIINLIINQFILKIPVSKVNQMKKLFY